MTSRRLLIGVASAALLCACAGPAQAAPIPALHEIFLAFERVSDQITTAVGNALGTAQVELVVNVLFSGLALGLFVWRFAGFALRGFDMMALLTGEDPDEVLLTPISTVKQAVVDELISDIASQVHAAGLWYPEIAPPSTRTNLVVTALRYNVDDAEFEMVGTFEVDGSSQAAVLGADGDGLEFQQFDAYIPGTFQSWFGFNRGALEEGEVRLTTEGPPFNRRLKAFRRD